MTYVYLLSTYDEYGSEDVVATLNRDGLPSMLDSVWGFEDQAQWSEGYRESRRAMAVAEAAKLRELLQRPDEELAAVDSGSTKRGHNLTDGWGGIQLHVVELQ